MSLPEHDEFRELCALSTADCLTERESQRLQEHLLACTECRNALREYQLLAGVGIPSLALDGDALVDGYETAIREAQPQTENVPTPGDQTAGSRSSFESCDREITTWSSKPISRFSFGTYSYFLAAIVLAGILMASGFFMGRARSTSSIPYSRSSDEKQEVLDHQITDLRHEQGILDERIAARDQEIADLHGKIATRLAEITRLNTKIKNFETGLKGAQAQSWQASTERDAASIRARQVESELVIAQRNLETAQEKNAEDEAQLIELRSEDAQLRGLLNDRNHTITSQQDLLEHDRDIRDLMGARDLYIAEVYDVGTNGETRKPFGRVFYTKGKSLIFYAYDLDRQPGVHDASTFQAWGSRGSDRAKALNLGIFYVDNAVRKRWVLKFDDPATLEQIDAVFVTVEPKGGSPKPSGKELLFAYLRVEPNHP